MEKEIEIGHPMLIGIAIIMKGFLSLQPQTEELNLESLFQNVKWKEIEDVVTKEYEVEKVTQTAGVRGNEAEDEILDYLYYRVSYNASQIPPKLAKKLNIR